MQRNIPSSTSRLLDRFEDGTVRSPLSSSKQTGVISKIEKDGLKVLGRGELTTAPWTVKAAKVFEDSAREAIEAAGGTAEVVPNV